MKKLDYNLYSPIGRRRKASASDTNRSTRIHTHVHTYNDFSLSRIVTPRGSTVLFPRCFSVFPGNRVRARLCVYHVCKLLGQVSREYGSHAGFDKHAGQREPAHAAVSYCVDRRRNRSPDTLCHQPAIAVQPGAGLVEK